MRIAIVGAGRVGTALGTALRAKGHQVIYGVRQPKTAGVDVIARPVFPQGRAAMFVAGPEGAAKDIVRGLVSDVGFEAVDAGELRNARLLEPLGMLSLQLGAEGRGRDFALLLASREAGRPQAARPCALMESEVQEAG